MLSLDRLFEIIVYALLDFVPFCILAVYPFKDRLRLPLPFTWLLVTILSCGQILFGVWTANFADDRVAVVTVVSTLLYAIFYIAALKVSLGKAIFTLLMLSNTANFVEVAAKCIEGQLFHEMALEAYRWSFSLMLFCVETVVLIPLFFYIKKAYAPAVKRESKDFEWRYLWIIPAIFYLLWFYGIYGIKNRTSLEVSLRPSNTVFLFFINLGAFLVYFIVTRLVNEQERNIKLEENNHSLVMQTLQYENLKERIAEASKAKHDVRHHITLMKEYIKKHKYDELSEYLELYQKSLPDDTMFRFCKNEAANSLFLYYAQQAKNNKIDFDIKINCPEKTNVSETDLSVLLGNVLENALDACINDTSTDPQNKKIIIRGKADEDSLCVTIDNTFSGKLKLAHSGNYISTKHSGIGLGLKSVKDIAERYNGSVQIEQKNNMFMVSVLLNQ